jgi:long-chain acyl-CoA synthetase
VRGEKVAGEYLGRGNQLTADGFFPTRDAGFADAEGYLFLDGRLDDVIVRGGENLSPGEIEDVLRDHPDVADCAVVGVPDEQWGEAVAAVIVARPGAAPSAEALRDFVRSRLRSSRAPERITFRPVLPYTETGKLLRRAVKAELLAETPA